MEATNTDLDAVAGGNLRVAKRAASEEVEGAPTAKRAETSEALSTSSNDHEPKPTFRVPLLEKVCQVHIN